MAVISLFSQDAGFDQDDINALSVALEDICKELKLPDGDNPVRRVIAERLIILARYGERNAAALRDRVLRESKLTRRNA